MHDAHAWLDEIAVRSPCTEPWEGMRGNDRVRHCASCRLDVHDLSTLTRAEAEALVRGTPGRLCARIHRRPDGRILTRDCRPARRALRRHRARVHALIAGALAFLGLAGCRQASEGTVTVGVVVPESYERVEEPTGGEAPAPSPVPPREASSEASCG